MENLTVTFVNAAVGVVNSLGGYPVKIKEEGSSMDWLRVEDEASLKSEVLRLLQSSPSGRVEMKRGIVA